MCGWVGVHTYTICVFCVLSVALITTVSRMILYPYMIIQYVTYHIHCTLNVAFYTESLRLITVRLSVHMNKSSGDFVIQLTTTSNCHSGTMDLTFPLCT